MSHGLDAPMTVAELRDALALLPAGLPVFAEYDGSWFRPTLRALDRGGLPDWMPERCLELS